MSKIELQQMTPSPYYDQSRDFQFIGRLFDVVLNSVKTNADMIYSNPLSADSNDKLADLMALTLGFKSKHKYTSVQLTALCSAFSEIMRNKGSLRSIELMINALLNAEGITDKFSYSFTDESGSGDAGAVKTKLTLYIPQQLTNLSLIRDALDYSLPAGIDCQIISQNVSAENATTQLRNEDSSVSQTIRDQSKLADLTKGH